MKVFFDTNLFIYLWEGGESARKRMVSRILRKIQADGAELATSTLTLAEILVHPIRSTLPGAVKAYVDRFVQLELVAFDATSAVLFAGIRAKQPDIKPPDAIQLACAARVGCDWFLTNDRRLAGIRVAGIGRCASYEEFPVG